MGAAAAKKAAADAEKAADAAKKEAAAAEAKAEKTEKEATEAKAKAEKEANDARDKGAQAEYIQTHIKQAKCQNNAGCSKAGLVGFCCPNLDGTHLECCGGAAELAEAPQTSHSKLHFLLFVSAFAALFAGIMWKRSRNKVQLTQYNMLG